MIFNILNRRSAGGEGEFATLIGGTSLIIATQSLERSTTNWLAGSRNADLIDHRFNEAGGKISLVDDAARNAPLPVNTGAHFLGPVDAAPAQQFDPLNLSTDDDRPPLESLLSEVVDDIAKQWFVS